MAEILSQTKDIPTASAAMKSSGKRPMPITINWLKDKTKLSNNNNNQNGSIDKRVVCFEFF